MSDPLIRVNEIFSSIQGESTWAGCPCIFIRLTGCPLRCSYCDTAYAFDEGVDMTLSEVLSQCSELAVRLVEITGGEPLAQEGCVPLAQALLERDCTVLVETSGALPIDVLPKDVIRIVDLKCPSSGMNDRMHWANLNKLTSQDEVKFVIADRTDYHWSLNVIERYDLAARCKAILLSPLTDTLDPQELAAWIVEDRPPVRLQLQLQKIIWPDTPRGV